MSKNTISQKHEALEGVFEFGTQSEENEMVAGIMSGLVEASQHQMGIALELTKLIVGKNSAEMMHAEEVLTVFKQSSKTVSESFPLKALWEKLTNT